MAEYWNARLKNFRESHGMTQAELSKKSGVSQSLISNLEKGKRNFTQESLDDILRVLNLDYHDLFVRNRAQEYSPNLNITVNSKEEKDQLNGTADDYRGIPLYESGRLAAGVNGVTFDPYESPASMVVVYKPELQGCFKHNLAAIKVGGDSMEPTITKGSIVVVDLSDKEQIDNKVFVVNTPEGGLDVASIKRVQKFESGFLLLSDNRNFPVLASPLDWNRLCVGRVVWMWRDIRNI